MLGLHHFGCRDLHRRIHVSALAHPFVVVRFAQVAHPRVGQQRHQKIAGPQVFRQPQSARQASATRTSGEQSFQFSQPPRHHKTLLVIHLDNVIENLQIHRRREKIFADALDHIGLRFNGGPGLHEVVIQGAVWIDANNLDRGIFFLQILPRAADGPAGAQPANKVRDLPFAVLPNLRSRGEVVRLGIHRVVVLIRIIGIGNFAREFLCHRVVAARIFRLHCRGAHDDFRAQGLQQIHFFLRLLVRCCKHAFVAAHCRHQRQPHAGIPRGAFDDRAARFQQAAFFGVINHGHADAVLHRPARVHELRLHVDPRLQVLGNAVQPHQRRMPDCFENVVALHPLSRSLLVGGFSAKVPSV